jgi:hypothetical protein
MTAFTNPFAQPFHHAAEQVLAAQRQVLDWQRSQLDLAHDHALASYKLGRAGFDTTATFGQDVMKSVVAAFAPAPTAAASA